MTWIARHAIVIIALVAVVVRGAAVIATAGPGPDLPDEVQYWDMAASLARGDGLVDELGFRATRMPLFPLLLSPFTRFEGGWTWALLCLAVASSTAVIFAGALAFRVVRSAWGLAISVRDARLIAALCAAAVALDPFLVYLARFALTENLFCPALLLWLTVGWPLTTESQPRPRRWLAVAACTVLCVYIRPGAVLLVPVWSAWVVWGSRRRGHALLGVLAVWIVIAASLVPWAARNHRLTGQWTLLTHRMGISLYDGLGPQATGASDLGAIKNSPEVSGLSEVQWNDHFKARAWASARDDVGRVMKLAVVKFGRTWRPWPAAEGHRGPATMIIGGLWTIGIVGLALFGLWRLPRRLHALCGLLFPVVMLTAMHMVFVGSVRYRLPIMPLVEVLAACGAVSWWLARRPSERGA